MTSDERIRIQAKLSDVFKPGAPIDSASLFSGRKDQVETIIDAIFQSGQHVALFGERGVGKTSLAKTLSEILGKAGIATLSSGTINCDGTDDFSTLWHKVFRELKVVLQTRGVGFNQGTTSQAVDLQGLLPKVVTPDDIRHALLRLPDAKQRKIIVLDELDRLPKGSVTTQMADTIKNLSDHVVPVTLILVGVADGIDQLISEHKSIERALVQVPMPRMSISELAAIVDNGFKTASMTIEPDATKLITRLSQGLPHFTHLISLNSAMKAVSQDRIHVSKEDVLSAIKDAVSKSHSLLSDYIRATSSPQKDNLYQHVLIACALAQKDELGWLPASSVVEPFSKLMGKQKSIPYFSRHLNEFCAEKRGLVLQKAGTVRRFRYRFSNPLMQPFTILHALSTNMISEGDLA
jgi:Cdc6-like AAA superfamily ATPase